MYGVSQKGRNEMFDSFKVSLCKSAGFSLAVAGLASMLALMPAAAQTTLSELAQYRGADRLEKLAAGAKAEGGLMVYTSFTVEDMTAVTDAFTKKYGVPVKIWRGSSEDVLQRGLAETRADHNVVDVYENSGRELEALAREKVLVAVESPTLAQIMPEAVPGHHLWVGSRLNLVVACYNTNLITAQQLPKTWTGLLDPQWKGKLGIEYEDYDWFATIAQQFQSEKEGVDFFRKLVSTNGLSVRKGHTLLTNLTASGEVPLALTVFDFTAKQVKQSGAPLDWFSIGPIPARLNGVAVSRNAPHPNAALLFHEYMIGEGQEILAARGVTTTNVSRVPLPKEIKIKIVDPAFLLDHGKKWRELYDEIVNAKK